MKKSIWFVWVIYLLMSLSAAGQYQYRGGETALGARIALGANFEGGTAGRAGLGLFNRQRRSHSVANEEP